MKSLFKNLVRLSPHGDFFLIQGTLTCAYDRDREYKETVDIFFVVLALVTAHKAI